MTTESKPPASPGKPAAKADDPKPARPAAKPVAQPPAFDERPLRFADLAPFAAQLEFDALIAGLRDGRGVVRANAALGMAAAGQVALDLVMLLRDSEPRVAAAAAEAIGLVGLQVQPLIPQILGMLGKARVGVGLAARAHRRRRPDPRGGAPRAGDDPPVGPGRAGPGPGRRLRGPVPAGRRARRPQGHTCGDLYIAATLRGDVRFSSGIRTTSEIRPIPGHRGM